MTYRRHRFPGEIISHAVWLYHRFSLSLREVEELLAERGIDVTYETIRQWCTKFGPEYARKLRRCEGRLGDIWHLDEVFVKIRGELHYLWRAVDQDGDVIDILVQKRRNRGAARRFFRLLLKEQQSSPSRIVTDKLRSYSAAKRDVMPAVQHWTTRYANNSEQERRVVSEANPEGGRQDVAHNRAEVSHQRTRRRERQMRGYPSLRSGFVGTVGTSPPATGPVTRRCA